MKISNYPVLSVGDRVILRKGAFPTDSLILDYITNNVLEITRISLEYDVPIYCVYLPDLKRELNIVLEDVKKKVVDDLPEM